MTTYGYVRVSTREQNDERQRIALREAGSFYGSDGDGILRHALSGAQYEQQPGETDLVSPGCLFRRPGTHWQRSRSRRF